MKERGGSDDEEESPGREVTHGGGACPVQNSAAPHRARHATLRQTRPCARMWAWRRVPRSPPPLLPPCPTRSSAGCDELPRTPRSTLSPQRGNVGGVAHRRVSRAEAAAASPLGLCGTWPATAKTVAVGVGGGGAVGGGRGRSSSSPRTPRGRRLPARRRLGAATVPQGLPPLASDVDGGGGLCCTQVEDMCKEDEEGGTAHQPPFLAANRCFTAPQCCAGLPVSLPVAVAPGRVVAPNLAVWCAFASTR